MKSFWTLHRGHCVATDFIDIEILTYWGWVQSMGLCLSNPVSSKSSWSLTADSKTVPKKNFSPLTFYAHHILSVRIHLWASYFEEPCEIEHLRFLTRSTELTPDLFRLDNLLVLYVLLERKINKDYFVKKFILLYKLRIIIFKVHIIYALTHDSELILHIPESFSIYPKFNRIVFVDCADTLLLQSRA